MAKKKNNKKKPKINKNISEIETSRTGGSIALTGFNYQLLFSCHMILQNLSETNNFIKLEGIEDIDLFKSKLELSEKTYHIQLKSSINKQDASYFYPILTNFLEVYLADDIRENKYYKLVYDFNVSIGNLSKLIDNKMDSSSTKYWKNKIDDIKKENNHWNWKKFNYIDFLEHLCFEKIVKEEIEQKIYEKIITQFTVNTGNEELYINSLFFNVLQFAINGKTLSHLDLKKIISEVQDNISKGDINPSYKWISKIDYNALNLDESEEAYFEGKKATPEDIKRKLPIRRDNLEQIIEESVSKNDITIIKSSSGQGKTTLAYQIAYNLKEIYSIYKLTWCKEIKELKNIVEYFRSKVKIGEKVLIILDNLDLDLKEWNQLSQDLKDELHINYKILVTTREDDWYKYSGDQSSLRSLNIIDIYLDLAQAKKLYKNLKERNMLHQNVSNWQTSWEQVQDKKLLIEYVFLLTHGELIQDRISFQLKKIAEENSSGITLKLLRIITLSDVLGIKLSVLSLLEDIKQNNALNDIDINSIILSIENEYFIKIDNNNNYIEGLHPVRSMHISDFLHKYSDKNETINCIINIVDQNYTEKLYSQIPVLLNDDKDKFYDKLAMKCSNESYHYINSAIKGIFSGSFYKYFNLNKKYFDDANKHGGLLLFLVEINPWNNNQNGGEVKTLQSLHNTSPENSNIKYLLDLSNEIDRFDIYNSDIYIFSHYLFKKLKSQELKRNINGFAFVANWLIRLDNDFRIISSEILENIWSKRFRYDFNEVSQLIYVVSISDVLKYQQFLSSCKPEILSYIKIKTETFDLYEETDEIFLKYILLPHNIDIANEESVNRIKNTCKFLPIYEIYNTDKISPKLEIVEQYNIANSAFKKMPKRNITIGFNSDLAEVWKNSILSQYEFTSVYDWQHYWFTLRTKIVEFLKLNIKFVEKIILKEKLTKSFTGKIDNLVDSIAIDLRCDKYFPHENRPFEDKIVDHKIYEQYLTSINNYLNQFASIVRDVKFKDLALHNLKDCNFRIIEFQKSIRKICNKTTVYFDLEELENQEITLLSKLQSITEYFFEVGYDRSFNSNAINKWKGKKQSQSITEIHEKLDIVEEYSGFKIVKPHRLIIEDHLTFLMIGVINIDMNDEEQINNLLQSLLPIGKLNITFIILIFLDDDLNATNYGLRLNNKFYIDLIKELENDSEETNVEASPPIPIDLKLKHINCFNENINIKELSNKFSNIKIDTFLSLLWEYSYYDNNYLVNCTDEKEYLKNKIKQLSNVIKSEWLEIEDKIPHQFKNEFLKIKDDVFSKKLVFNEERLNQVLNKYINFIGKLQQ